MNKMKCKIESCDHETYARAWCRNHYRRWKRHGDPTYVAWDPVRRFWNNVAPSGDCLVWTGYVSDHGYASFLNRGKRVLVHRFSYELHNGPIPDDMQIDHTCHIRSCVRPEHLRLATRKQNAENIYGATTRSSTGIRGVTRSKHHNKWRASVGHSGKFIHVGLFETKEEAEEAVIAKRNELFTHNHVDRRVTQAK